MERGESGLQGVVCCSLDPENSVKSTIIKILDPKDSIFHQGVFHHELELKNKYYTAKIHLVDYDDLPDQERATGILEDCSAIIIFADCARLTIDTLNERLDKLRVVGGEPRILLCKGFVEDSTEHRFVSKWCLDNGYDLVDSEDESAQTQLIDSLSAYKWKIRTEVDEPHNKPKLNDETIKKLVDFDLLLGKLSAYRDRPELRGDPDDKNIIEIAEILSGLLGDDVDSFLDQE